MKRYGAGGEICLICGKYISDGGGGVCSCSRPFNNNKGISGTTVVHYFGGHVPTPPVNLNFGGGVQEGRLEYDDAERMFGGGHFQAEGEGGHGII